MDSLFYFAQELIEKASDLVLKNVKKAKDISHKGSFSNLVTNVDHQVESLIINEISRRYPEHTIIAEESGIKKKDLKYTWLVDPIDGTTNFAHGYPCFCISIGFSRNGVTEFGLVKNPLTGELYSAIRNKGAKLDGAKISVSKIKKLQNSLLVTGFPHGKRKEEKKNFKLFQKLTLMTHGVRRDGSAALDLCYVASGKVDGFWEETLNPWDVASGVLIVEEAGGKVTNYKGNEFSIYTDKVVASNGLIHRELIKHLK